MLCLRGFEVLAALALRLERVWGGARLLCDRESYVCCTFCASVLPYGKDRYCLLYALSIEMRKELVDYALFQIELFALCMLTEFVMGRSFLLSALTVLRVVSAGIDIVMLKGGP